MSLHVIRDTISHMHTDAIVNTANPFPVVGSGCDKTIYKAACVFAGVTEDFKKKEIIISILLLLQLFNKSI